jgi:signal transduction histidine kinase
MVRQLRRLFHSDPVSQRRLWSPLAALTLGLALATAALVWFGYRATREWQRSAAELVEGRVEEVLALLIAAITRDMKGAQVSVLVPTSYETIAPQFSHDFRQTSARAFALFPYPESFFIWKDTGSGDGIVHFFNRADRPPAWDATVPTEDPYPVVLVQDPSPVDGLVRQARALADSGRSFGLVEAMIAGTPYQAIVHMLYAGPIQRPDIDPPGAGVAPGGGRTPVLVGLVGFTINMSWVRSEYFPEIVRQVARIGGRRDDMSLTITAEDGQVIASNGVTSADGPIRERSFPLLFVDPDLTSATAPRRPVPPFWTARVSPARDSAMLAVTAGATRTFILISIAALATFVGLAATARAARASAELAAMKSEFISTVTHELKTPLALIRLVSETLAMGRYTSPGTIGDYARLLSLESDRLIRLVDNLLTYARISDTRQMYSFEAIEVADLVEDALESFHPRLAQLEMKLDVEVPTTLAHARIDRTSMLKVVDNLVDNALKYAAAGKYLRISARANETLLHLEIADRGPGIGPEESARVFDKFFRGRSAPAGGSGLGLTIAQRIVHDHGGHIEFRSVPGVGTTVDVTLMLWEG